MPEHRFFSIQESKFIYQFLKLNDHLLSTQIPPNLPLKKGGVTQIQILI
jgi:hypothetical protein